MYCGLKVAVIIPAYNEEANIARVIETVPCFIDWIFVVEDCSSDETSRRVKGEKVFLIKNAENQGVGYSILMGHKAASGVGSDVNVVMAGDGQMNPAYLPRLLDEIAEGADYAKGNRFGDMRGMPASRKFGNLILSLLTKIASGYYGIWDSQNGYTALRMATFQRLDVDHIAKRYQFENDMLIHLGLIGAKVKDVPMPAEYHGEKSKLKITSFIPEVIRFLLQRFVWKMRQGNRAG